MGTDMMNGADNTKLKGKGIANLNNPVRQPAGDNTMLAQVVGIVVGSPEFQRR